MSLKKEILLGTAPKEAILRYIERSGGDKKVIRTLFVNNSTERHQFKNCCKILSYGSKIGPINLPLLIYFLLNRPQRVIIICGKNFFHENVLVFLKVIKFLFRIKFETLCSMEGECAGPIPSFIIPQKLYYPLYGYLILFVIIAICGGAVWAGVYVHSTFTWILFALLFLAEIPPRIRKVWKRKGPVSKEETRIITQSADGLSISVQDKILGWRNKPNLSFEQTIQTPDKQQSYTWACRIDQDGCRLSQIEPNENKRPEILILGSSWSFGYALNDSDTFPWMLQKEFPGYCVKNFSALSYSLYQQFLLLEERISARHNIRLAVVSFVHNFDKWITAPYERMAASLSNMIPGCVSKNRHLRRFPPHGYLYVPFSDSSFLVKFLETSINKLRFAGRNSGATQRHTAEHLLLQFKSTCEKNGIELLIVCLDNCHSYYDFFQSNGFSWCICEVDFTEQNEAGQDRWLLTPFDTHPNRQAHTEFALEIGKACNELLSGRITRPAMNFFPSAASHAQKRNKAAGLQEELYPLF